MMNTAATLFSGRVAEIRRQGISREQRHVEIQRLWKRLPIVPQDGAGLIWMLADESPSDPGSTASQTRFARTVFQQFLVPPQSGNPYAYSFPERMTGSPDGSFTFNQFTPAIGGPLPLFAGDFGFTLPAAASVTGLRVRYVVRDPEGRNVARNGVVYLAYCEGNLGRFWQGASRDVAAAGVWAATAGDLVFGGSADTWQIFPLFLTGAEFNRSTLGVAIQISTTGSGSMPPGRTELDACEMTVWYR